VYIYIKIKYFNILYEQNWAERASFIDLLRDDLIREEVIKNNIPYPHKFKVYNKIFYPFVILM
jgi:hypothetical protein